MVAPDVLSVHEEVNGAGWLTVEPKRRHVGLEGGFEEYECREQPRVHVRQVHAVEPVSGNPVVKVIRVLRSHLQLSGASAVA